MSDRSTTSRRGFAKALATAAAAPALLPAAARPRSGGPDTRRDAHARPNARGPVLGLRGAHGDRPDSLGQAPFRRAARRDREGGGRPPARGRGDEEGHAHERGRARRRLLRRRSGRPLMAPLADDRLLPLRRGPFAKIKAKQLSPVALAEGYLERLERLGPKLGAVVTVTRDLALKEARAAEAEIAAGKWRGPLHGIPYGVKDLLATKGIPTTWGAAAVPRPGLRLRRDGRDEAARGGRRSCREARDGRARGRIRLQQRGRLLHGPGPHARGTRSSGRAARRRAPARRQPPGSSRSRSARRRRAPS